MGHILLFSALGALSFAAGMPGLRDMVEAVALGRQRKDWQESGCWHECWMVGRTEDGDGFGIVILKALLGLLL